MDKIKKKELFEKLMTDYTGRPTIIKNEIPKALGITINEANQAVKDLSYFGKKSHYYVIDEVAEELVSYMDNNKITQEKLVEKAESRIDDDILKLAKSKGDKPFWLIT